MPVDQIERVVTSKGALTGTELIQGDAERIKITTPIDRAVHASGLFGRDIGQGARETLRAR
jgi:hypothetical protein